MNQKILIRLIFSGLVAFICYALWAYYANSLVTDDQYLLIRAALVQGAYSGSITLVFTFLLEYFYKRYGSSTFCLALIVPTLNKNLITKEPCATKETFKRGLRLSEQKCKGHCIPGRMLSPIPALLIQAISVTAINIVFNTPNILLTIAPSIIFSAIYGYLYSFSLAKSSIQH